MLGNRKKIAKFLMSTLLLLAALPSSMAVTVLCPVSIDAIKKTTSKLDNNLFLSSQLYFLLRTRVPPESRKNINE
jgi:hypothetical protein